ncbi:MAG: hypothetical protein ACI87E_000774, partial [Mariniblastus sp.]
KDENSMDLIVGWCRFRSSPVCRLRSFQDRWSPFAPPKDNQTTLSLAGTDNLTAGDRSALQLD